MFRAALKSLLGRKVRLLMSTFAVVLGVAFVAGTLVFTDTLNRSFTALFASTVGDVVVEPDGAAQAEARAALDAEVKDGRSDGKPPPGKEKGTKKPPVDTTLPASLVAKLATLDGAARADGNVLNGATFAFDATGKVMGSAGTALASNWTGAPAGHGLRGLVIVQGREPTGPDEVVFDASTAERSGWSVGSQVTVVTSGREEPLTPTLVGVADFAEGGSFSGATWMAFETRFAQELFMGGNDRFTSIWVTARDGVSQEQLKAQVQAELPEGFVARTGDEVSDEAASQLLTAISFLTTFLLIFAGISLVVGAFLIVNTFSILVAQRSRELALLRALGASRRQVTASVMLEALVLGVLGSTIGIVLGIAMATVIRSLFGTFGLDLSGQPLVLKPRTFVVSYVVGIVVTMSAAWFPARRSARIAPVQAMRDEVAMPENSLRNRFLGGVGLVLVGLGVLFAGLQGGDTAGPLVGAGILFILLGVSAAAPVISQPFLVVARELFGSGLGMVGRLAGQNSLRNPRRTAATASALMIGLALASTMAIVGDSAKASVDRALSISFRGDYIVSNAVGQAFPTSVTDKIRAIDGVTTVVAQRLASAQAADEDFPQGVVALPRKGLTGLLDVQFLRGDERQLGKDAIVVGESWAKENDLDVGGTWPVLINNVRVDLEVVAVFADNPVLKFPVVTVPRTFTGVGLAEADALLVVDVEVPGAVMESRISEALEGMPTMNIQDQATFAEEQRRPINQMVTMIFALLGLALVIAVLGIVNTLALSVIERTKEIGLLRAIGLSRAQTWQMVTVESVVIAALGALLGVVLGVGFGLALMQSLREEGLEVVSVPWNQLGVFLVVALVVGVLAAVVPARRASRLDVLDAISTD